MQKFKEEFWKETSKLIDAHRKNDDERASQGIVDCRILFTRLIKNLNIFDVSKCTRCKQLEFMIENGLGWKDMENDITYPRT